MIRDLARLGSSTFDVVIIGGGVYGASAACDAASRGLSVALLERVDFGHATSAQSLRVVHGGLRYLQNLDIRRIRASDRERKTLMRIAPHLVQVLPVVLPTYSTGIQRRPIIAAALAMHELLSCDRNLGIRDPGKLFPVARLISRRDCLRLAPGLPTAGLTGGAIYYDGQTTNAERLTLAFVRSAANHGAFVANYLEACGFLRHGDRICGVVATDLRTGQTIDIPAKTVLNTAGPWVDSVIQAPGGLEQARAPVPYVKTINIVTRALTDTHAIALTVPRRDSHGNAGAGGRLVYIAPWKGSSMIGSAHFVDDGGANACVATEDNIAMLLDDVNAAYPVGALTPDDVRLVRCGLVPAADTGDSDPYRTARHERIIDHGREGAEGLVSVVGVKWTTARYVAEKAVSLVADKLAASAGPSRSDRTPLHAGDIENFGDLLNDVLRQRPYTLPDASLDQLVRNHGSEWGAVLGLAEQRRDLAETVSHTSPVLKAQIVHAVRNEMALTLDDIVFRRTELATAGHPGSEDLQSAAALMAEELGWDAQTIGREVAATERSLGRAHARPRVGGTAVGKPRIGIEVP
jgi:glycerol-3-phosphate dehydrogenase